MPWLSEVPEHWDARRNGRLFAERRETDFPDLPILEVSLRTGVKVRDFENSQRKQIMADLAGYKCARQGDIAYNMMRMWQGAFGLATVDGLVSPAYVVARPFEETNSRYYSYLFRTDAYMGEIDNSSHGIVKDRNRLYWDDFKQMASPFPPPAEQEAIVRFLDHHGRLVSRFIRAKRRLIELLNEQKLAIVHQAVTRGLDPDVPFKPSGVDWLGDIPAHWEATTVKREFDCLDSQRIPLSAEERGKMTVREFDYYGASGVIDQVSDYIFDDELILLAEDGANLVLRNLPLSIIAKGRFWVNNHAHVLKPKRSNLEYLAFLLETLDFRPWITGAAQPKLTGQRLLSIALAMPDLDEQDRIVADILQRTNNIAAAIQRTKNEVSLILEYRTRLIADLVAGRLDVCEAVASLESIGVTEDSDLGGLEIETTELVGGLENEMDDE